MHRSGHGKAGRPRAGMGPRNKYLRGETTLVPVTALWIKHRISRDRPLPLEDN
jgi:hypothetical protein